MMKQIKSDSRMLLFLLFLLCCLTGCKVPRKTETPKLPESACYLSSRARLTIPSEDAVFTINGTMKLTSGEQMQLSFLMPAIRTEVACMEMTPREILLVDRMSKRYIRATRKELEDILPKKADFTHLEKILFDASRPKGRREPTGKGLGIPSLGKGRVGLSDSSYGPPPLAPTEPSSRYTEVELSEILKMLMSL